MKASLKVSAIIVTRGDVDLRPVLDSLPREWEQVVWNNSGSDAGATVSVRDPRKHERESGAVKMQQVGHDISVYGRYHAIQYASHDLIYVQDDDCILSDPNEILEWWYRWQAATEEEKGHPHFSHVICNMPQEFRHDFYTDHALVGFGAAFHRDVPARAFSQLWIQMAKTRGFAVPEGRIWERALELANDPSYWPQFFHRTCDIPFTGLSPRVLVEIPKENLPWAEADNRMWKQSDHQGERARMRELMLAARKETS